MLNRLAHFFLPRPSNNHRAKALHLSSLMVYVLLIFSLQFGLSLFAKIQPGVLGYASSISIADLLKETNARRTENKLDPLQLNEKLSSAALAKGQDMFANQYWAHVSPSGKDPWSFVKQSGYNYVFAGENLARDFPDSKAVVDAWMKSPSHRENLLNPRYKEIGFAAVNGKYGNYETTIVVQLFGTPTSLVPSIETNDEAPSLGQAPAVSTLQPEVLAIPQQQTITSSPRVDIVSLTRTSSLIFAGVMALLLVVDGVIVYRKKIVRVSGRSSAHFLFFLLLLAILNVLQQGLIL